MPQCLLFPDLAQLLATRFLILQHSITSMAKQIKNLAGHQTKFTVVLRLVLKRDRHDETKGQLPAALTKYSNLDFGEKNNIFKKVFSIVSFYVFFFFRSLSFFFSFFFFFREENLFQNKNLPVRIFQEQIVQNSSIRKTTCKFYYIAFDIKRFCRNGLISGQVHVTL